MPAGSAAKAASVGAKTVKGPGPSRVEVRPAASTAARSVLKDPALRAVAMMVPAAAWEPLLVEAPDAVFEEGVLDAQPMSAERQHAMMIFFTMNSLFVCRVVAVQT